MQIGVANGSLQNSGLFRNNSGADYPYDIASAISLTSSSANTNPLGYYYFFYDIEVEILCDGITTGVNTEISNSNIVKYFDFLGREVETPKNQFLFYIYDDGVVEKKIIIK